MPDGVPYLTLRGTASPRESGPSAGALAAQFRSDRCVTLPGLLDPAALAWVQRQIATTTLFERDHGDVDSTELTLPIGPCLGFLTFLANDPPFLRFIERLTGIAPLTRFAGRVYSRIPGAHHDAWHDDIHPDRLVGMSINLSTGVYDGGLFEIREFETKRPLGKIANTGFGDAILFAIGEGLEHRVSPLAGTVAKTAFAGWFGAALDYNAELRRDPALADES